MQQRKISVSRTKQKFCSPFKFNVNFCWIIVSYVVNIDTNIKFGGGALNLFYNLMARKKNSSAKSSYDVTTDRSHMLLFHAILLRKRNYRLNF